MQSFELVWLMVAVYVVRSSTAWKSRKFSKFWGVTHLRARIMRYDGWYQNRSTPSHNLHVLGYILNPQVTPGSSWNYAILLKDDGHPEQDLHFQSLGVRPSTPPFSIQGAPSKITATVSWCYNTPLCNTHTYHISTCSCAWLNCRAECWTHGVWVTMQPVLLPPALWRRPIPTSKWHCFHLEQRNFALPNYPPLLQRTDGRLQIFSFVSVPK